MTTEFSPMTFSYRAATPQGQEISGTIDAIDASDAGRRLSSLQLIVQQLKPARRALSFRPMGAQDFRAFNQQLAQLTAAGLPVEHGLRMIATELRRGRMRRAVGKIAAELEQGKTLPQAVDAHRADFPPLYARLLEAGIRTGNLPGVLLNLGKHLALMQRLRVVLWHLLAYPLVVLAALLVVFCFIVIDFMPMVEGVYKEFHSELPVMTRALFDEGEMLPGQLKILAVFVAAAVVVGWWVIRATGAGRSLIEQINLRLPLLAPLLRQNLVARWCDSMALGAEAGLDLPASVELADEAIASPMLKQDGQAVTEALSAGRPINSVEGKILPPMVLTAMELASQRNDLLPTLNSMSQIYQQQAQNRLAVIPAILAPIILIFIGLLVAMLMLAIFLPLMQVFGIGL